MNGYTFVFDNTVYTQNIRTEAYIGFARTLWNEEERYNDMYKTLRQDSSINFMEDSSHPIGTDFGPPYNEPPTPKPDDPVKPVDPVNPDDGDSSHGGGGTIDPEKPGDSGDEESWAKKHMLVVIVLVALVLLACLGIVYKLCFAKGPGGQSMGMGYGKSLI